MEIFFIRVFENFIPTAKAQSVVRKGLIFALICSFGTTLTNIRAQSLQLRYPEAKRSDTVDVYFGTRVVDPYQWLEDEHSQETSQWLRDEDTLTKEFIRGFPARTQIQNRVAELMSYDLYSSVIKRGDRYFFTKLTAGSSRPVLYVQNGLRDRPRVLFDPAKSNDSESQVIASFVPSPDGRWIAYRASKGQSRWVTVGILNVDTGDHQSELLSGLNAIDANIAWRADNSGFFYTAFDKPSEMSEQHSAVKNPRIYFHKLGDPQSADAIIYSRPDKPDWLYSYSVTADDHYLVIQTTAGSNLRSHILYKDLSSKKDEIKILIDEADAQYTFLGSQDRRFWLYTTLNAPRGRVIEMDLQNPTRSAWREIVPEAPESIAAQSSVGGNALGMFGNKFVLMYLRDGRPFLRVFSLTGRLLYERQLPIGGSLWGSGNGFSGSQGDDEMFYQFLGLTEPSTIYRMDLRSGKTTAFLQSEVKFRRDRYITEQVFYQSKDGARVPMFITHRKDLKLDGNNPAYIYGYGAFGWISFIWYQPHILAWLEMGGLYAQPSLRGGGEYGESWHQAGMKAKQQNAADDYIAAAEWLIRNKYTSPKLLVANGGSASAKTAAAAIIQRPELFAASVLDRPVLDMLRYDKFTGGSYWKPEFGSPQDPTEFKALYSYSPYHNLGTDRCYPPTLLMSGDRDQTAVPLHAYKFTAAMQAAQNCDNAVLLKIMRGAGHNFGATREQMTDSFTDELTFLAKVLGLDVSRQHNNPAATGR